MIQKIIVDALYGDEIRLAVCSDNVVREFYYQNSQKKPIKGNIYIARVSKIEPSLQAAFIDYGQEKQGFLPLSDIHFSHFNLSADQENELQKIRDKFCTKNLQNKDPVNAKEKKRLSNKAEDSGLREEVLEDEVGEELDHEYQNAINKFYNKLKIQDILKEGHELLVQIKKAERGSKGAALSTNITLAGRYAVLMPKRTIVGCGVSKKICNVDERERLRKIAADLVNVEELGSLIIRTAGEDKTKTEIKRDFAYLTKLWKSIKDHSSKHKAPAFIHEEGDIIKKCIRDLYHSEIDEIIVSGAAAYQNAFSFVKLIMPKQIEKVKEYKDLMPIFSAYKIEAQVNRLYDNKVFLPSGGYVVINQTEALVAIDVNSGRSTLEDDIEITALKTNIEAVKEIMNQLKLRDMSGLIVIDFIDMLENKNKRVVESELKALAKLDRARTQLGKIGEFGLLEMSRQRLGNSIFDSTFTNCELCSGQGRIRSLDATASAVLRAIVHNIALVHKHEEGSNCLEKGCVIELSASTSLITHMLNHRHQEISDISTKMESKILFVVDEKMGQDGFYLENKKNYEHRNSIGPKSTIDDAPYVEMQKVAGDRRYRGINDASGEGEDNNGSGGNCYRREHYSENHDNRRNKKGKEHSFDNREDGRRYNEENSNQDHGNTRKQSLSNRNRRPRSESGVDAKYGGGHRNKKKFGGNNRRVNYARNAHDHREGYSNYSNDYMQEKEDVKPQVQSKEDKSLLKKIFDKLVD